MQKKMDINIVKLSNVDNANFENSLLLAVQQLIGEQHVHAKIPMTIVEQPRIGLSSASMFDAVGTAAYEIKPLVRSIKMPALSAVLTAGVTEQMITSFDIEFNEYSELNRNVESLEDVEIDSDFIFQNRIFLNSDKIISPWRIIINYNQNTSAYETSFDALEIEDVDIANRRITVDSEIFEIDKFYRFTDEQSVLNQMLFKAVSQTELALDYEKSVDENNQLIDVFFPNATIENTVAFEVFNPKPIALPSELKIFKVS
jgi:hypothetical protein